MAFIRDTVALGWFSMSFKKLRKNKVIAFLAALIILLFVTAVLVIWTDPFLHYHAPYPYLSIRLDNERMQNCGIIKNLDYNAVISGSSMTENFCTSEFDMLFSTVSVKIPFSGATFFEVSEEIRHAYESGHSLQYVFRSFDLNHIAEDHDSIRTDLGEYPFYLYNKSVFDDYKYILNSDVIFSYSIPALTGLINHDRRGMTSFDDYMSWRVGQETGKEVVLRGRESFSFPKAQMHLSKEDINQIMLNVRENITDLADAHPETVYIYFIPPYSVYWWGLQKENGEFERTIEAEKLALKEMLQRENIRVHCFTNMFDFTEDLNNYKDESHYLTETNSDILQMIKNNEGRVTPENLNSVLVMQRDYYVNYDYDSIFN